MSPTLFEMWQCTVAVRCYMSYFMSDVTGNGYIRMWQICCTCRIYILHVCCDRRRIYLMWYILYYTFAVTGNGYIGCDRYVASVTSGYCTLAVTCNGYIWCDIYCTIRLLWQAKDIYWMWQICFTCHIYILHVSCDRQRIYLMWYILYYSFAVTGNGYIGCDRYVAPVTPRYCTFSGVQFGGKVIPEGLQ